MTLRLLFVHSRCYVHVTLPIAMYFAWLGFYTQWLIAPAILGVIIVLIGLGVTSEAQVHTPSIYVNSHILLLFI